jgi:hypothetical protein
VTTPAVTETRRAGQTNEPIELARYTASAGQRVIHGEPVLGVVRLVDGPASGEAATTSSRASSRRYLFRSLAAGWLRSARER